MSDKTHWKKLVNPDYIGVYSLEEGKDMIVTIISVAREMVTSTNGKKEECTVAKLKGQKPMILNRTNCKTIQKLYGTPYIEEWANKTIQLFAATTKLAGDDVECLRIRPTVPNKKLPVLKVSDKVNFDKVKAAIESGYTLDQIKTKWDIPEETQIALNV